MKNLNERTVRVKKVTFPEDFIIYDVLDMATLRGLAQEQPIFESDKDFHFTKLNVVFRLLKPNALTVKVNNIFLARSAFTTQIQVSRKELLKFAKEEDLTPFETKDGLLFLPGLDFLVFASKKKVGNIEDKIDKFLKQVVV